MLPFEYYNPVRVVFGPGEVNRVGREAKELGRKALIVSYSDIGLLSAAVDMVHKSLEEHKVGYIDHFEVTANPMLSQARSGIALGKLNEVDLIIGLGGGSAMDCAKIIAAGMLYPHELKQMILFSHKADNQHIPPSEALPMIMIPTLPATASEMNPTAVITDDGTMRKSYVWEPSCLYPKVSILDPNLTTTLPAYQTASGAVDTMSHVIEPFLFSDEESFGNISLQEEMQAAVIRVIRDNVHQVLSEPDNIELRGLMQWSATVALNGWLTTGVQGWTPMHQTGHVLSSHYGATHGATLSCMMLAWMRFFASHKQNERFKKLSQIMWETDDILEAANRFETWIKDLGVETRISEFGAKPEDIDKLVESVMLVSFGDDHRLASVPPIDQDDLHQIFALAF